MYEIVRYNPEYKKKWDTFISVSKNSTFLFYRDFMEYHSDTFSDHSFLFFNKNSLVAVIPGNLHENAFYSHEGLTYGGFVTGNKVGTKNILDIFCLLNSELKKNGINEVIYKPVPYIYHTLPSQEDLYALFRLNAKRVACNISSSVFQENKIKFRRLRTRKINLGLKNKIQIREDFDFESFWALMNRNLMSKYNTKAVHSVEEIKKLAFTFPDNIKLYKADLNNEYLAGAVIFKTRRVAHVQYLHSSETGKKMGAPDYLLSELIHKVYSNVPIFDLGTSNENDGTFLNENLAFHKEGFGARGIVYETYKYCIG